MVSHTFIAPRRLTRAYGNLTTAVLAADKRNYCEIKQIDVRAFQCTHVMHLQGSMTKLDVRPILYAADSGKPRLMLIQSACISR